MKPAPLVKRALILLAAFAVIAAAGILAGRAITGPFNDLVARDFDTPIRNFVERPRSHAWHDFFAHLSTLGTAVVTGAIAAIVGMTWSLRARRPIIAVRPSARRSELAVRFGRKLSWATAR